MAEEIYIQKSVFEKAEILFLNLHSVEAHMIVERFCL